MPDYIFENASGRLNGKTICGVDEVGRGPLAGPVIACAAIIPHQGLPPALQSMIRDSKQLSDTQRNRLYPDLVALCPHALGEASATEIDHINILQASLLAMRRAVAALPLTPDHALIDGNRSPGIDCAMTLIIKGDSKSLSIAVASIIAKVTRDQLMRQLAHQHPAYGWERNAGYPTADHLAALERHGLTPHHRQSFAPVARRLRQSA
jgi:ribonuclease HII